MNKNNIFLIIFISIILVGFFVIIFSYSYNEDNPITRQTIQESDKKSNNQINQINVEDIFLTPPDLEGNWRFGEIEDWSKLEESGFKKILYREAKLTDDTTLELKEKWLEVMIWESYSNETAKEFYYNQKSERILDMVSVFKNYSYIETNNSFRENYVESFHLKERSVSTILFVKDKIVLNVLYHSNFKEDYNSFVNEISEKILKKFG